MKIIFIGTVEFSYKALQLLVELKADLVGVATKEGPSVNADFADLKPLCIENNIPYKIVNDVNHPNNVAWIIGKRPDVIFCFGWSNLIKADLLKAARLGVIGYHPAELPFNKGRHPIIWSLALGLKRTASSFFFMDEGADTGDILSQKLIAISNEDDARSLYDRIVSVALSQIEEFFPQLISGSYSLTPQDKRAGNTWRKRGRSDGRIDFRMSSTGIYNLVRALTKPYVGAHIEFRNTDIKVWKCSKIENKFDNIEPGKVLATNGNEILVKTGDGAILIEHHEFPELPQIGSYL